jgi:3-phosphoshikimate 1-carboxyvinyltransferase
MQCLHLRAPRAKRASVALPGDKSISHRALFLSALAVGKTRIEGANAGADVSATVTALRQLGVPIKRSGDAYIVTGASALVAPRKRVDCGNSGTTMRLLAGFAAGRTRALLDGDASLRRRPMARLVDPLRELGADVSCARGGVPPIRIACNGPLAGGRVRLSVPSAQVESALVLAALHARASSTIVSGWPVRDHLRRMSRDFGARLQVRGRELHIKPGVLHSPRSLAIPGDLSAAVFFLCAAAVLPGSCLTLRRVGINPSRLRIVRILQSMGVDVAIIHRARLGSEPVADLVVRGGHALRHVSVPAKVVPEIIDEIPALCALAATAPGISVIRGVGELRYKESDRVATTIALLESFGVRARARHDALFVRGGSLRAPARVRSFGDHRIAMAATILAAAVRAPITIVDSACIETSFPGFARTWRAAF